MTDSPTYNNKFYCTSVSCIPPFTNLAICPVECTSIYACYDHCDNSSWGFNLIKVYIGDSTTFNDASNTLCGEASHDYTFSTIGVISCNRATTAQYIHFVHWNTNGVDMWIEQLKVFSEEEIGRSVTQVDSNGTYDNAPLPGTVGEIAPEYVNVATTFTASSGNSIVSYKLAAVSDISSILLESSTSSPTIKIVNSVDSSE